MASYAENVIFDDVIMGERTQTQISEDKGFRAESSIYNLIKQVMIKPMPNII